MKGLSFLEKISFIINSIAALLLLLSYGLSFLPPQKFGLLSVLSLGVPLLIFLNFGFVVYWLIKLKRQMWLSIIVLTFGFNYISSMYQLSGVKGESNDDLTVISYNVRLFNVFNWIDKPNVAKDIERFIIEEQPLILSIQEYHPNDKFNPETYYKFESVSGGQVKSGLAILSKFPIIDSGAITFPNTSNKAIYADILLPNDTLRIYNLHLQSSKINPSVESLKNETSEHLIKSITKTFQKQEEQANLILAHLSSSPYKALITGDFNNTAYSYVYNKIRGDYQDAFEIAGSGFGSTYDFKFFPLRIDFILVDKDLKINGYKTFDLENSDHKPIKASLRIHP